MADRRRSTTSRVTASELARLAATIDHQPPAHAVPILWHWSAFHEMVPTGTLGIDGHPRAGGVIEDPPHGRRMFAGVRARLLRPWPVGVVVERRTVVGPFTTKIGSSGPLTFVTVHHEYRIGGEVVADEEQDLVYREPATAGPAAGSPGRPDRAPGRSRGPAPSLRRERTISHVELFRFSAVTFNSHRIHYDADHAREVEGYPGLVVHGPLLAVHLSVLASTALGREVTRFSARARSPVFVGDTIHLDANHSGDGRVELEASMATATIMTAEATAD